jgi:hypothetical protein
MLIMMGIRCQCYRKLLALSIKKLRLSFQRSRLESSLVQALFFQQNKGDRLFSCAYPTEKARKYVKILASKGVKL